MDKSQSCKYLLIIFYLISEKESVFALLKAHKAIFVGLKDVNLRDLTRAHFNQLRNWIAPERLASLTVTKRKRVLEQRLQEENDILECPQKREKNSKNEFFFHKKKFLNFFQIFI